MININCYFMGNIMKKSTRISLKPDWNKIEGVRNTGQKFLSVHGFGEDD